MAGVAALSKAKRSLLQSYLDARATQPRVGPTIVAASSSSEPAPLTISQEQLIRRELSRPDVPPLYNECIQLRMMGPLVEMGRAKTVDRDVVTRGAKLDGDFVIGRWTLEKPTVRFSEVLRDVGNVGTGILRQFAITIDPANARLRLVGPSNGKIAAPPEEPKR